MVSLSILASSSSGNCAFLRCGDTRILIDAGLSRKQTAQRLTVIGEDIANLSGILLTHEHHDHVAGLPVILKQSRTPLPVYMTGGTNDSLQSVSSAQTFRAGYAFEHGPFSISTFGIPHDAAEPVGYRITAEGITVCIATDLGMMTPNVAKQLQGADLVLLESNHDIDMLRVGPYDPRVKERILSDVGHLSNEAAAHYLATGLDSTVSNVILGHLSAENNDPELALATGKLALQHRSAFTQITVAEPGKPTREFVY